VTAPVARAHLERLCAGHFPGDPLVPGAYLAELMAAAAATLVGATAAPARLARVAFHAPVRPADDVVVRARRAGGGAVVAGVWVGARRAAEAVLHFEAAA